MPTIPRWFDFALVYGVGLYALCRGPREARLAGVYYAVSCSIIPVFMLVRPEYAVMSDIPHANWIDLGIAILDVMVFSALMLRSKRYWTVLASSLALCEVATSVAHLISAVLLWAYGTMQLIWTYGMLIVIAWGARSASGAERGSWRLTPRSVLAHIKARRPPRR